MLDASTRIDVLNLLGDLKSRGLGILFITHDLSLGNYISDRTMILRRGSRRRDGRDRARLRQPAPPVHEDAARVGARSCTRSGRTLDGRRRTAGPDAASARRRAGRGRGRPLRRARRRRGRRRHDERRARGAARRRAPAGIPWEERPPGSSDVVWRSSRNPIIAARPHPAREQHLQLRRRARSATASPASSASTTRARTMNLHAGRSADGVDWEIDPEPIAFVAADDARRARSRTPFEHAYDPRVTLARGSLLRHLVQRLPRPDDRRRRGRTTSRRSTSSTTRSCPFNRNGVLFPRRIGGRYAMLSRPSDNGHTPFGDIFYSESPDLVHWGRHRHVHGARAAGRGSRPRSAPGRPRSRRTRAGSSSTTACSRPATASSTRWAPRCSTSTSPGSVLARGTRLPPLAAGARTSRSATSRTSSSRAPRSSIARPTACRSTTAPPTPSSASPTRHLSEIDFLKG